MTTTRRVNADCCATFRRRHVFMLFLSDRHKIYFKYECDENRYVIRRLIEIRMRFAIDHVVHESADHKHEIDCTAQMSCFSDNCARR